MIYFRFGHPDTRASYSERLSARQRSSNGGRAPSEAVYKSNSSLDLDHEADILQESGVVTSVGQSQARREYGSHGSLDMMGRGVTNGGEATNGNPLCSVLLNLLDNLTQLYSTLLNIT